MQQLIFSLLLYLSACLALSLAFCSSLPPPLSISICPSLPPSLRSSLNSLHLYAQLIPTAGTRPVSRIIIIAVFVWIKTPSQFYLRAVCSYKSVVISFPFLQHSMKLVRPHEYASRSITLFPVYIFPWNNPMGNQLCACMCDGFTTQHTRPTTPHPFI